MGKEKPTIVKERDIRRHENLKIAHGRVHGQYRELGRPRGGWGFRERLSRLFKRSDTIYTLPTHR